MIHKRTPRTYLTLKPLLGFLVVAVVLFVGRLFSFGEYRDLLGQIQSQLNAKSSVTVVYGEKGFEPTTLSISQGTKVYFKNNSTKALCVGVLPKNSKYPCKVIPPKKGQWWSKDPFIAIKTWSIVNERNREHILTLTVAVKTLIEATKKTEPEKQKEVSSVADQKVSKTQFKTWKTVQLGTYKTTKELREALEAQGDKFKSVNNSLGDVSLSSTRIDVDLVRVALADLDLKEGIAMKDVIARAKGLGLSLAPAEVGPQLRLQYQDQPLNEELFIAMNPLIDVDRVFAQAIFSLSRVENERVLHFANGDQNSLWSGAKQLIFVRNIKTGGVSVVSPAQPLLEISKDNRLMLTAPAEIQLIFWWQNAGYNNRVEIAGAPSKNGFMCHDVSKGFSTSAGTFPVGEIRVQLTSGVGKVFYTGPSSVNPDNVVHVKPIRLSPSSVEIGWEDLLGGGDNDFNDCTVEVRATAFQ